VPYIDETRREALRPHLIRLTEELGAMGHEAGDLNFCISFLLLYAWDGFNSYARGNALIGVLECAKQEFYRRFLAPYEDRAIRRNGDLP
jgi:hypothetical protein